MKVGVVRPGYEDGWLAGFKRALVMVDDGATTEQLLDWVEAGAAGEGYELKRSCGCSAEAHPERENALRGQAWRYGQATCALGWPTPWMPL